jgi:hypothetical protein
MAKKEGLMKNLSAEEAALKNVEQTKEMEKSAEWAAAHHHQ